MRTRDLSRRSGRRSVPFVGPMDRLEPRALLSAYAFEHSFDRLDFDETLTRIEADDLTLGEDSRFGFQAVTLGDLNADGITDFAVSAPGTLASDDFSGVAGVVIVFSGANNAVLYTLADGHANFGHALAAIGDLNADGFADLLVGSPNAQQTGGSDDPLGEGAAYAYSGLNGSLLWVFRHDQARAEAGFAVAEIPDLNSDATPDIAVGAPGAGERGMVFALSGDDGVLLWSSDGVAEDNDLFTPGWRFGHALASLGSEGGQEDLLAVGSPDFADDSVTNRAGAVFILDREGGRIHVIKGDQGGSGFGSQLAFLGTVYEQYRALAVAAPGQDAVNSFGEGSTRQDAGLVTIVTNYDHSEYWYSNYYFEGTAAGDRYGERLALTGDLDGDTFAEFAASSPGASGGAGRITITEVRNFSFTSLLSIQGGPGEALGSGAILSSDFNRDGFPDILVGEPGHSSDAGRVSVRSGITLLAPTIAGASRDLDTFWSHPYETTGRTGREFIVVQGQYRLFTDVPNLGRARIAAVASDGTIAAYELTQLTDTQGNITGYDLGAPFLLKDGVKSLIVNPTTQYVGPDLGSARFNIIGMSDEGTILGQRTNNEGRETTWMWKNNVFTHLWDGYAADISPAGVIVGTRIPSAGIGVTSLRTTDGKITEIKDLFNAAAVNDSGAVVGMNSSSTLVVSLNGVTTTRGSLNVGNGRDGSLTRARINNAGQILAFVTNTLNGQSVTHALIADGPTGAAAPLAPRIFGTQPGPLTGPAVVATGLFALDADGDMAGPLGVLETIEDDEVFIARDDAFPSAASLTGGTAGIVVSVVNPTGDVTVFRLAPTGGWSAFSATAASLAGIRAETLSFIDPRNDSPYVVALFDSGMALIALDDGGSVTTPFAAPSGKDGLIVGGLTTLTSLDSRVHVFGYTASGDLVMYYQTGNTDASGAAVWAFSNFREDHLEPQSLTLPAFVGGLTAYVTSWNGLNIAGLDSGGDIHTVWWAPGLDLWSTSNLSDITGAPALVGQLTPYVTSWGGINLAGNLSDGTLSVTWWVPQFGADWETNNLTTEFDGPTLLTGTITSYTTSWGGLNIVGQDAAGEVIVYWWTPTTNVWRTDSLTGTLPDDAPDISGRMSATQSVGSTLNIFGRADGDSGDVIRLYWEPSFGEVWRLENLTDIATLP